MMNHQTQSMKRLMDSFITMNCASVVSLHLSVMLFSSFIITTQSGTNQDKEARQLWPFVLYYVTRVTNDGYGKSYNARIKWHQYRVEWSLQTRNPNSIVNRTSQTNIPSVTQKCPAFYATQRRLMCTQDPATGPHSNLDEACLPHSPTQCS
jgi:hypothetical protein